jgi:hypothetical protein
VIRLLVRVSGGQAQSPHREAARPITRFLDADMVSIDSGCSLHGRVRPASVSRVREKNLPRNQVIEGRRPNRPSSDGYRQSPRRMARGPRSAPAEDRTSGLEMGDDVSAVGGRRYVARCTKNGVPPRCAGETAEHPVGGSFVIYGWHRELPRRRHVRDHIPRPARRRGDETSEGDVPSGPRPRGSSPGEPDVIVAIAIVSVESGEQAEWVAAERLHGALDTAGL